MKKFPKLISALFLTFQVLSMIPMHVSANEIGTSTEPATHIKDSSSGKDSSSTESSVSTKSSTTASRSHSSSTSTTKSSSTSSSETSTSSSTASTNQISSTATQPSTTIPSSSQTQPAPTVAAPEEPVVQAPENPAQAGNNDIQQDTPEPDVTDETTHFEKDDSVESFIRKVGEPARKIGQEKDLYASVMIAQAILESGGGQSSLAQAPNYNLFGIKGSHNGKSVSMSTQEDSGKGDLYTIQSDFRVYKDYEDCFNDYATLLKEGIDGNSDFYSGVWKTNAKTYQEATKYLTGRYATDSKYNQKLNGLIETYDLTQYDHKESTGIVNNTGYQVPVDHYTITCPFGSQGGEFHRGLDLAANQGEPIHACKAGTVLKAEYHPSWGNYVVIEHADGMTTLYAHQQQYIVKAGDKVRQGQTIGYVGSTGNSTGPHVHVEVCTDTSLLQSHLIDPQKVLGLESH